MFRLALETSLALLALAFTAGCSTVPKDAPPVFHDAAAAIDEAEEEDVDDIFPETMKQAKTHLKEAVSQWEEDDFEETSDETESRQNAASVKAFKAKEMAEGARQLTENLEEWDSDFDQLQGNYSIPELLGKINTLQEEQDQLMAGASVKTPFPRASNFRVLAPIAYFDSESADLDSYYKAGIQELATVLQGDANLFVTVSGYADPRGEELYNLDLSNARAQAVAAVLKEGNVPANRLQIVPMGEKLAHYQMGAAKLQLERRVDVVITAGQPRISE